jgi:hypothetical protein
MPFIFAKCIRIRDDHHPENHHFPADTRITTSTAKGNNTNDLRIVNLPMVHDIFTNASWCFVKPLNYPLRCIKVYSDPSLNSNLLGRTVHTSHSISADCSSSYTYYAHRWRRDLLPQHLELLWQFERFACGGDVDGLITDVARQRILTLGGVAPPPVLSSSGSTGGDSIAPGSTTTTTGTGNHPWMIEHLYLFLDEYIVATMERAGAYQFPPCLDTKDNDENGACSWNTFFESVPYIPIEKDQMEMIRQKGEPLFANIPSTFNSVSVAMEDYIWRPG